jgi:hypothetical protein
MSGSRTSEPWKYATRQGQRHWERKGHSHAARTCTHTGHAASVERRAAAYAVQTTHDTLVGETGGWSHRKRPGRTRRPVSERERAERAA